jgi:hypothetical protein
MPLLVMTVPPFLLLLVLNKPFEDFILDGTTDRGFLTVQPSMEFLLDANLIVVTGHLQTSTSWSLFFF